MPKANRIIDTEFPIHVSVRSNNRDYFPLPMPMMWEVLTDYLHILNKGFEIEILSFVLMSNHLHMICRDPLGILSDGMEYFLRETSKEIGRLSGRINRIWGAPFFNSVIRNPLYYLQAYKYIYRNPVRAGLCEKVESYPYSSLAMLLGVRHGILPLACDDTLFCGEPGEILEWLNTDFSAIENESISAALRKKEFKLRKDPSSRNPLLLESWSSVPSLTKKITER